MVALKAKHPKKAKLRKPKILIFGKPGVGKTWAALDFPSVFYVDCEGGATLGQYTDKLVASGGGYLGPEDGANDFQVILGQIRALATTEHEYKTLVIDSYSKLFNTRVTEKYESMEERGSDMDKTFGRENKPAVSATKKMLVWFDRLDMNVIFVCHEKDMWSDGKVVGQTFDGWAKLEYELDLVMRIEKQGASRKARVGKCRLDQFREGEAIDWSYASFAKRYGIDVIESESQSVRPATAEQIDVVQKLSEAVKLETESRIKWFDKAGVDAWGQMDSDTVQKCIDHLKSQLPTSAIS